MTPDTIVEGDTIFIRCVVEDSLDPSLVYTWGLNKDRIIAVNGRKDSNVIRWHDNIVDRFRNYPDSITVASTGGYVVVNKNDSIIEYNEVTNHFVIRIKKKSDD